MRRRYMGMVAVVLVSLVNSVWGQSSQRTWTVTSPGKKLALAVTLEDEPDQPGSLSYRVALGNDVVLGSAPLGVRMGGKGGDFTRGLTFVEAVSRVIRQTYRMASGKCSVHHHRARETTLIFRDALNRRMHVIARASDDGVAWRYHFPATGDGDVDDDVMIAAEASAFRVPADSIGWLQPYVTYYEKPYPKRTFGEDVGEVGFPALVRTGSDAWMLLTEAAVYEDYAGAHLKADAHDPALLHVVFPGPVHWRLPWSTPWRVAIVSKDLGDLVASTLVDDLNPPCALDDKRWVRPGRVVFPWWSDFQANSKPDRLRAFIDFAAEQGFEWIEFDTGLVGGHVTDDWRTRRWVPEIVAYAEQRGVMAYGWDAWQKLANPADRAALLDRLVALGFRGIKVDYLDSDAQERFAVRDAIIRDCAKRRLLVSFHGATIPRGQRRRWPHVMTWEGVMGGEWYGPQGVEHKQHPSAVHNCTLPFTRNVVGPMDYTPITISERALGRTTSDAHELALSVIFESGWQCFADSPEAYADWPGTAFLKQVPAVWDETKLVEGFPGEYVVLARRKGDAWFLAGITGDARKSLALDLSFMKGGSYDAKIYVDDGPGSEVQGRPIKCDPAKPLELAMPARSGFSLRVPGSVAR